jgi:flavin-dependent dehydrogenase
MHFQAVIIGAGPAGLACAKILSQNGIQTLVVEKQQTIGAKVCAGGLTWGGLAGRIPEYLVERAFPVQHIKTRFQSLSVRSDDPIIVTVNREKLGSYMLDQATASGAQVLSSTRVTKISDGSLILKPHPGNMEQKVTFDYLVGADGSTSLVRRYLALPAVKMGIGLNYQIPGEYRKMEWHLKADYFQNGYSWIFPHSTSFSIGAYIDASCMQAGTLKKNLIHWAAKIGIDLSTEKCRAGLINFDYRGWDFGHIFLAGDAAGLASALTGEGIYPAIVSGETVARKIIDPDNDSESLDRIARKQQYHQRLVHLTGKSQAVNLLLCEMLAFALRLKLLRFHHLEMTD